MIYIHTSERKILNGLVEYFSLRKDMSSQEELLKNENIKLTYSKANIYKIAFSLISIFTKAQLQENDYFLSLDYYNNFQEKEKFMINKLEFNDEKDLYPDVFFQGFLKRSLVTAKMKDNMLSDLTGYHVYMFAEKYFKADRIIILRISETDLNHKDIYELIEDLVEEKPGNEFDEIFQDFIFEKKLTFSQKNILKKLFYYKYLKEKDKFLIYIKQINEKDFNYENIKKAISLK